MGMDRTWQSFVVKICQRDNFPSYTLTFLVWNLSRHLPWVYRRMGTNIRDAVVLRWSKEKRLETLWSKKTRSKVTKSRGIHNHRKRNRRPIQSRLLSYTRKKKSAQKISFSLILPALSVYFAYRSVSHNPGISPWVIGNPFLQKYVGI